jgi:hypothetical protein
MRKTKRSKTKRSKTKRRNRKHNYLGKARIKYYSIKKVGGGPESNRSVTPRSNRSVTPRSNRSVTPRSNRIVTQGSSEDLKRERAMLVVKRKGDSLRKRANMMKQGAKPIEELIMIDEANMAAIADERAAIADEKAAVGPIPMREPDYVVDNMETNEAFMKRVKSAALKRKRAMSTVKTKADKLRLIAEMKKRGANSDEDLNIIYATEKAARAAEKAGMLARAKKTADDERRARFKDSMAAMINASTAYNKYGYKSINDE